MIIKIIIFVIIFLFYLLMFISFNSNKNIFIPESKLNIKIPKKIEKECIEIKYLTKYEIFGIKKSKTKIKEKNLTKINQNKEKNDLVLIQDNRITYLNQTFYYLGDVIKHKKFAIFKTKENNKTKFIQLSKNNSLIDSLILIENNRTNLLFKLKNKTYILIKNYIDINKFKGKK